MQLGSWKDALDDLDNSVRLSKQVIKTFSTPRFLRSAKTCRPLLLAPKYANREKAIENGSKQIALPFFEIDIETAGVPSTLL